MQFHILARFCRVGCRVSYSSQYLQREKQSKLLRERDAEVHILASFLQRAGERDAKFHILPSLCREMQSSIFKAEMVAEFYSQPAFAERDIV